MAICVIRGSPYQRPAGIWLLKGQIVYCCLNLSNCSELDFNLDSEAAGFREVSYSRDLAASSSI